MLDIKFYLLDGINGLLLLDILSCMIELDNNGKDFFNNFLWNGIYVGGILKMKGVLDNKKVRDCVREEFYKSFSGIK